MESSLFKAWRLTLAKPGDPILEGVKSFVIVADCFTLLYPELHLELSKEVDLALSVCPEIESYNSIRDSVKQFLEAGFKLRKVVSMPRPCCFQLQYASYEACRCGRLDTPSEYLVAVDGEFKKLYEEALRNRRYVRFPSRYRETGSIWVRSRPV